MKVGFKNLRVLVAHPGLQHSHQLGVALYKRGYLSGFWSGVPITSHPGTGWSRLDKAVRLVGIPPELKRTFIFFPLLRRLVHTVASDSAAYTLSHRLDNAFDLFVSQALRLVRFDIFVGYENSCLNSFRVAKRQGAICILDAASIHPATKQVWMADPWPRSTARINQRKFSEICSADAIITCSSLAADTYRLATGRIDSIYSCPLGTQFPLLDEIPKHPKPLLSFVFVGQLVMHKGGDHLIAAFQRLGAQREPVHLTIIGKGGDTDLLNVAKQMTNVTISSFLPQVDLFKELAQHDCLILPSRFDSFGMVVAEAMAAGLPVIVSDHVGAKSIVEQSPGCGWVVAVGAEPLIAAISRLVKNRDLLATASKHAKIAAQSYSWDAYHQRVVSIVEAIATRRWR